MIKRGARHSQPCRSRSRRAPGARYRPRAGDAGASILPRRHHAKQCAPRAGLEPSHGLRLEMIGSGEFEQSAADALRGRPAMGARPVPDEIIT